MSCVQVLGPKTYAGKQMAAVGNHHHGEEVPDIHLLKAAAHEAVAHPRLGLVPCTDDTRPEWVAYPYSNAHPILRWLPSKLADSMQSGYQKILQRSLPYQQNVGISGQ